MGLKAHATKKPALLGLERRKYSAAASAWDSQPGSVLRLVVMMFAAFGILARLEVLDGF